MKTEIETPYKDTGNNFELFANDIFDVEEIQRLQDLFSDATGVASIITYLDGTPITKPSNFCRLCKDIIRKTEKGCSNCFKSDAVIGMHNLVGPTIQLCLSGGLWDAGASITIGNKHIANWLIGQIRNEDTDEQHMIKYAEEIGTDKNVFIEAFREVPVMSVERFKKVADMLFVYANELSDRIYKNIQLKRQIAEQERINELLQKSVETLSITLQSIGDGVISTDKNGFIVNMNPVAEHLCGWKLSQAIGKSLSEVFNIINVESRQTIDNPVAKVLEKGKVVGLANHTVLISKIGTEHHIADSAAPIKNREGAIIGVVLVFSDITEKYKTEENLIESERSKSVLLENLSGMAYRCKFDRNWTKEFVSKGCVELTGYQVADFINNRTISFNELILPEYREHLWEVWGKASLIKKSVCEEYQISTADNQIKWVMEQGIPIYNSAGEVEALEGLIIDITDRKRAEERLQNERLLLRTLVDNIPDLIYAKDLASRKTLANKAEVNVLGAKVEAEVLGKDDFNYYPKEFAEKYYADDQRVLQSGKPLLNHEESIIDSAGLRRWMIFSKLPLLDINNQIVGLIGIGHDITNRKILEENLQESENFLKETQVIANLGSCIMDIPSRTWKSSDIMDSIFGINSNLDKSFKSIVSIIHPEWKKILEEYFIHDVIENKSKFDKKFKIIRQIDREERWVHAVGKLKMDTENNPAQLIATVQDITDQIKSAEVLQRSEELYRSILDASPDAIVVVEMDETIRMISPKALSMYQCDTEDQLIGSKMFRLIAPEDIERAKLNGLRMFQGHNVTEEYRMKRFNGELFFAEVNGNIIWNTEGQPTGFVFIVRDITERKEIEDALRKSEEKYRTIFENLQDVFYQVKIDGNFFEVSPSVKHLTEFDRSEIIGNSIEKLYANPQDRQLALDTLLVNKQVVDYEIDLKTKNGLIKHASLNARLIYDSQGRPDHIDGFMRDITTRKLQEKILIESEKKFHDYIEFAPHGIFITDESGKYIEVNSAASIITGYHKKELIFMNPADLITAQSLESFKNHFKTVINKGFAKDEFELVRKDKSRCYIAVDTVKLTEKLYVGFVVDISLRKKAEEELKLSEAFLKETQLIANLGICTIDVQSKSWSSSAILNTIFGIDPDYNKSLSSLSLLVHPEWQEAMNKYFINEVLITHSKYNNKFKIIRQNDNHERWVHAMGEWKMDLENNPIQLIATIQDITEQINSAEIIKRSEALYRSILDTSPDAIVVVEMDEKIRMVSPKAVSMYHCQTEAQLIGCNLFELIATEDRERAKLNVYRMFQGYNVTEEYRTIRLSGEMFFSEVNGDIIWNSEGQPTGFVFIVRDITDRKKAEEDLLREQLLLKTFMNSLPGIFYLYTYPDLRLVLWNKNLESVFGLNTEEIKNRKIWEWHIPDMQSVVRESIESIIENGQDMMETFLLKKDGTTIPYITTGVKLEIAGEKYFMGVGIDNTSQKAAEAALSHSQEQLKKFASHLQNVREEEKILLAREIHDELGQILIAIKIDLGMMKQKVLKVIKKTDAENILTIFDNLFALVDNTIKTTKKIMTDLRPEVLYLLGFIEAVKLYVNKYQERHKINCYFESTIPTLELNTQQSIALYRILQESLTNVAKHAKATSVKIHLYKENQQLIFEIGDNGIGLIENYKNKHDSYGLIGMRERVFLLDGELTILSKPGKGTTIKVEMPYKANKER